MGPAVLVLTGEGLWALYGTAERPPPLLGLYPTRRQALADLRAAEDAEAEGNDSCPGDETS